MKNISFYITLGISFVLYRFFYYCYYGDMMGYLRVSEISSFLKIFLLIWPLLIFIVLILLTFKIGSKKCMIWERKEKAITLLIIIVVQIVPIGFIFDAILPYGFSRKY